MHQTHFCKKGVDFLTENIAVSYFLRFGNKCSIAYSIPGFCKPIAFIIPLAVSQTLGGLFPGLGFNDVPFVIIPPNLLKSKNSENSSPYPKVPDATVTGFFIFIPANSTLVFIFFLLFFYFIKILPACFFNTWYFSFMC